MGYNCHSVNHFLHTNMLFIKNLLQKFTRTKITSSNFVIYFFLTIFAIIFLKNIFFIEGQETCQKNNHKPVLAIFFKFLETHFQEIHETHVAMLYLITVANIFSFTFHEISFVKRITSVWIAPKYFFFHT